MEEIFKPLVKIACALQPLCRASSLTLEELWLYATVALFLSRFWRVKALHNDRNFAANTPHHVAACAQARLSKDTVQQLIKCIWSNLADVCNVTGRVVVPHRLSRQHHPHGLAGVRAAL